MDGFKDFTSTSFGLIIAYLLPGLGGLAAASLWLDPVQELLAAVAKAEANVGSFIFVLLLGLAVGLEISLLRYVAFEWHRQFWAGTDERLTPEENARIHTRLEAWRAAVDETYRYHQFWGGMAFVILAVTIGLAGELAWWFTVFVCLPLLLLTIAGAWDTYTSYVRYAKAILSEGD